MQANSTCIEVILKPSMEELRVAARILEDALRELDCDYSGESSWLLGLCPGGVLVEAGLERPRDPRGSPVVLALLIRVSGEARGVYESARTIMEALRSRRVPAELLPGCQRLV